jgi:lipid-A-disaccharide synthase
LPNLIADEPLLPESYNEQAHPRRLERQLEQLLTIGPARQVQIDGFDRLRTRMHCDEPPGIKSARLVLDLMRKA